ncbi:MAG: leucine-rich repeat protein [Muribaculaceae bacterium]|nr:leucine-rich repeat protein [Muribaculaceae bacterium]
MKTKTITRQLLMALVCIATAFSAWSYDLQVDGIYYNVWSNQATVTYESEQGVASYSGNVVIPSSFTYNGTTYNVTGIGDNAFEGCTDLTTITIPNSVTWIGEYAFYGCTNLFGSNGNYYFFLPENIALIREYAFGGGNAIIQFEVDPNNEYFSCHNGVLYNKNKTKLISFPSGSTLTVLTSSFFPSTLTTIGNGAFGDCHQLTGLEIPGSVTQIGGWAFDGCTGLKRVIIPESVTTIGTCAFRYAYNMETVICLISTPPTIDDEAFSCFNIATLVVPPSSLTAYRNASEWKRFTAIKSANFDFVYNGVFYKITSSTNKTVAVVRSIDEQSFDSYDYMGVVSIPPTVTYAGNTYTVTTIDNYAFYYNKQLERVYLPPTVTTIGERAFYGCENLQVLSLNEGLTEIGRYAVCICHSLTSITLPETLTTIGEYAFYNSGLNSIVIPNSVTTIEQGTFEMCAGLESVVLGTGITDIGPSTFANCSSLIHITSMATTPPSITSSTFTSYQYNNATLIVPKASLSAYQEATYWSNFTNFETTGTTFEYNGIYYYINDDGQTASVTYKDTNYNSYSGNVVVPEYVYYNGFNYKVNAIGERAFYNCQSLLSVSMPSCILSIGKHSFDKCTALTSISLPYYLTVIGDYAFYSCTSLSSIDLCDQLKTISQFSLSHTAINSISIPSSVDSISYTAFNYCNSLTGITVNLHNQKYCSIDRVLFSKDGKTLVAYPGAHAANYTVPNGTEVIMASAFRGGETLSHVTLPTSLREIQHSAFFENISLEEIVVPNGVTTIGNSAFSGCSSMTRAELPSTLTSLGYLAFNNVPDLTELIVKAQTPPTCAIYYNPRTGEVYEAFMDDHYNNVTLTVPTGCTAAYQTASTWKKFMIIEEESFPIESVRGDVNGDGNISIADVTALIDYLLDSSSSVATGADCNLDGSISIADVTALIDYLLQNSWGDKKCIELWGLSGIDFGNTQWGIGGGSIGVDLQPLYPIQGYSYDDNGHGILEYTGYFSAPSFFLITKPDRSESIQNDGGAFYVEEDGYYTVSLNTATHEVSITPFTPSTGLAPATYPTMCIAGDVTDWVANTLFMQPVNPRSVQNHDWYLTLNVTSNSIMKFVYDSWYAFWGSETFPYGTGYATGDNIPVPAGEYQIMFNDITGNYIFVPGTYPQIPEW